MLPCTNYVILSMASSLWLLSWNSNSSCVNIPEKGGCTQVTQLGKVSLPSGHQQLVSVTWLFFRYELKQLIILKGKDTWGPVLMSVASFVTIHILDRSVLHTVVRWCLYCLPGHNAFVPSPAHSLTWLSWDQCWVGSCVLLGAGKQGSLTRGMEALPVIPFTLGFTDPALWSLDWCLLKLEAALWKPRPFRVS